MPLISILRYALVLKMASQSTNLDSQPGLPLYNILLTLPRTSSHLLTQILNLGAQPGIHRHPSDGYFFIQPTVQRFTHHLAGKHVSSWTEEERDIVRDAFQRSYEQVDTFVKEVQRHGKSSYAKIHINWIVEPVSESRYLYPLSASSTVIAPNDSGIALEQDVTVPWTIDPTLDAPGDSAILPRSPFNETALPDSVLRNWKATFLIRHPALTFPSLLRTGIDNEGIATVLQQESTQRWEATFHWSRTLYEFYASLSNSERATRDPSISYPIILDADDILNAKLVTKYARAVGLDGEQIRYEWKRASSDEIERLSAVERRMKDTLLQSEGIVQGKTAQGLVIEEEIGKWKAEFGEVLANRLESLVKGTLHDYEWLWEKRLKL